MQNEPLAAMVTTCMPTRLEYCHAKAIITTRNKDLDYVGLYVLCNDDCENTERMRTQDVKILVS